MNYCGVLNIDKPAGLTSRDVVNRIVRMVHPAKVGHAGTLDPLATGILVVCVGHATRLIPFAQEGRKKYLGRFVLGQTSDTDDITGNIVQGDRSDLVTPQQIETLLPEFVGEISQVPPQFSAVHVQGRRAYELARRGEVVEISPRMVEVHQLRLTDFQPPEFELEIDCGSGTYVRSIGRDLGQRLGCGALMKELRRLAVGSFETGDSLQLDSLSKENLNQFLKPAQEIVAQFPERSLTRDEVIAIRCGQSIKAGQQLPAKRSREVSSTVLSDRDGVPNLPESRLTLMSPDGIMIGIGEIDTVSHRIQPRIVFPATL